MWTPTPINRSCLLPATIALASLVSGAMAATVTATVHYQKEIGLACNVNSCSATFPKPGANHQLNLTRMSCQLNAQSGTEYNVGTVQLHASNGAHILYEHLPVDHSSSAGYHILDRTIDIQVAAYQYVDVQLLIVAGTINYGFCTAIGTLDTLG